MSGYVVTGETSPAGSLASGRRLARGFATVTGARFVGLALSLVQIKLAVTYLGPNHYGLLLTATLFVQSLAAWTELGFGSVVVRRVSGQGADLRHTVGLSMAISCLVVIPLTLAVNVGGFLLYRDQPIVLAGVSILSIGLIFQTWATCYNPVAQVTSRFGRYASADLIGRVASIAIVTYAITADAGLPLFFVAQLMLPLGQLIAMLSLGKSVGRFRPVWNRAEMVGLVKETLPLSYILVVGVLYYTIDGVLLSKLSTPEQVGAYGLAYKTIGNLTIVSTALVNVMAARFAQEARVSAERLVASLRKAVRAILLVAVPVATLVWPLRSDIVRFVGSEEMVDTAAYPMVFVAIAIAFGMVSAVISQALISAFQQRVLTRLNTFNLVLNITLNIILIPRYGATGAAIALLVSELNGLAVASILTSRRFAHFVPVSTCLRLIPVVAISLILQSMLHGIPWWARVVAVVVSWFVLLFVFRLVTARDVRQLLAPHEREGEPAT